MCVRMSSRTRGFRTKEPTRNDETSRVKKKAPCEYIKSKDRTLPASDANESSSAAVQNRKLSWLPSPSAFRLALSPRSSDFDSVSSSPAYPPFPFPSSSLAPLPQGFLPLRADDPKGEAKVAARAVSAGTVGGRGPPSGRRRRCGSRHSPIPSIATRRRGGSRSRNSVRSRAIIAL